MSRGYCFSCGRLRETEGGLCEQCRIDRAVRDYPARLLRRLRGGFKVPPKKRGKGGGK